MVVLEYQYGTAAFSMELQAWNCRGVNVDFTTAMRAPFEAEVFIKLIFKPMMQNLSRRKIVEITSEGTAMSMTNIQHHNEPGCN